MARTGSPPLLSDFLQEMLRGHAFDPDPQGELFDDFRHGLASFIRNSTAKINDLDDRMKTLQSTVTRLETERVVVFKTLQDLKAKLASSEEDKVAAVEIAMKELRAQLGSSVQG